MRKDIWCNAKHAYKNYRASSDDPVKRTKYTEVTKTYFALLMKSVIDDGAVYKLPNRLGKIGVVTYSSNRSTYVDFATGEIKRHRNLHADNLTAKIVWDKSHPNCLLRYKGYLNFKISKGWRQYLKQQIELENTIHKYQRR